MISLRFLLNTTYWSCDARRADVCDNLDIVPYGAVWIFRMLHLGVDGKSIL
jgi:hypothetical protein